MRGGPRPRYPFSTLLRCGVCGANYMVRDLKYYACSFNRNRGPHVCPNGKVVRREKLERLLDVIEQEVFSPESVAYLTNRVNDALSRLGTKNTFRQRLLETELHDAEKELENIKVAIRRGIITDTTKTMPEPAEWRVQMARAKMPVSAQPEMAASMRAFPSMIDTHIKDLRTILYLDTDRARLMLSKLVGQIVLRPEEDGLVAEIRGNVGSLLNVEPGIPNGAGRGI